MSDEALWMQVEKSNIPRWAISHTLPELGQHELRECLHEDGLLVLDAEETEITGFLGVSVSARTVKDVRKSRKVFYVCAKELMLGGFTLDCMYLSKLISMVMNDKYEEQEKLFRYSFLFIDGFYDFGMPPPFDGLACHKTSALISRLIDGGIGVCTLIDQSPKPSFPRWWPQRLLDALKENSVSAVVGRESSVNLDVGE